MNEHDAQRIAAAISQARPDWPARQILTLINSKLADRPRRDVFVALAWIAAESDSTTPYRVLESGPWWKAAGADATDSGSSAIRNPFDRATACDTCSQPEHLHHANSGHKFESVLDAMRRRDETPKPALPRVRELLAAATPNHEGDPE